MDMNWNVLVTGCKKLCLININSEFVWRTYLNFCWQKITGILRKVYKIHKFSHILVYINRVCIQFR